MALIKASAACAISTNIKKYQNDVPGHKYNVVINCLTFPNKHSCCLLLMYLTSLPSIWS